MLNFEDIPDAPGEAVIIPQQEADPFGEQQSSTITEQSAWQAQPSESAFVTEPQQAWTEEPAQQQTWTEEPSESAYVTEPQQAWTEEPAQQQTWTEEQPIQQQTWTEEQPKQPAWSEEPQQQVWSDASFGEDIPQQNFAAQQEEEQPWTMPEPEADDALTSFNTAWQATLNAKLASEMEAEKAVKMKAAEDMSNWMAQRDIRLRAKKDSNRSEEQVLLENLESEVDANNNWERVTKLIDAGESADAAKADVTRMRKLFIQLKNEPITTTH